MVRLVEWWAYGVDEPDGAWPGGWSTSEASVPLELSFLILSPEKASEWRWGRPKGLLGG